MINLKPITEMTEDELREAISELDRARQRARENRATAVKNAAEATTGGPKAPRARKVRAPADEIEERLARLSDEELLAEEGGEATEEAGDGKGA